VNTNSKVIVEDIFPGTPEWEESEYALGYKRRPRRRTPEWIRRMNEGKLPNKDLTGKGPDAA